MRSRDGGHLYAKREQNEHIYFFYHRRTILSSCLLIFLSTVFLVGIAHQAFAHVLHRTKQLIARSFSGFVSFWIAGSNSKTYRVMIAKVSQSLKKREDMFLKRSVLPRSITRNARINVLFCILLMYWLPIHLFLHMLCL